MDSAKSLSGAASKPTIKVRAVSSEYAAHHSLLTVLQLWSTAVYPCRINSYLSVTVTEKITTLPTLFAVCGS